MSLVGRRLLLIPVCSYWECQLGWLDGHVFPPNTYAHISCVLESMRVIACTLGPHQSRGEEPGILLKTEVLYYYLPWGECYTYKK